MLFITILSFYYVVVLYAFDTVFPEMASSSITDFLDSLTSMSLGPIKPVMVIITAAFDLVWLAFVGALVVRHTGYMIVNITTYEVLVRPAHVLRRFPRNRGRFWFLQGFGPVSCIQHCINYWSLNTDQDTADFLGSTQDSFVAGKAPSVSGLDALGSQTTSAFDSDNKGTWQQTGNPASHPYYSVGDTTNAMYQNDPGAFNASSDAHPRHSRGGQRSGWGMGF